MLDPYSKRQVRINSYNGQGGRIVIRMEKMEELKALLDANGIRYWIDEGIVSLDGAPPVGFINVNRQTPAEVVQALLDAAT